MTSCLIRVRKTASMISEGKPPAVEMIKRKEDRIRMAILPNRSNFGAKSTLFLIIRSGAADC